MFDTLSDKLEGVFRGLTGRGSISPEDIKKAMNEVERALIEADVNLRVTRSFIAAIEEEAVGEKVLKGLNPGQQVVKIVNDKLIEVLGGENEKLITSPQAPTIIMMVGLQGSGKTTHVAKLARMLRKGGKRPLMVACDTQRPAAVDQLQTLGKQLNIPVYSEGTEPRPPEIAKRALDAARKGGNDVIILDTAGRLQIDDALMTELEEVKGNTKPHEILLVVDAMTGQESVNVAEEFNRRVGLTGVILTKMDGDARGGAALSVRAVTGVPIKFMGTGEKTDAIEPFYPDRIASRILGMGDILTLIEKAQQQFDEAEAQKLQEKMKKGSFDLEDFVDQLRKIRKMGSLSGLLGLLPGVGKQMKELRNALETPEAERELSRTEAIVMSMTKNERHNPDLIDSSRRKRIAKGSGVQVSDVNNLLQQFRTMRQMMRSMGKGEMPNMGALMGGGGGAGGGFGGVNSRKSNQPKQVDPLAAYKSGKPGGPRPTKKKK
ncbi:signal recognition particle protein [Candidatus Chlorohelix sp.]|uniref:signal recognition particle protein n=1 Tax=Candidatus Chlorohelix sp. TaxID=3139201 RepID=UPI00302A9584